MNIFTIVSPDMERIGIQYAPGSNMIEATNKIMLIKAIRNSTLCSLKDAKDFVDLFVNALNKLTPDVDKMRSDIIASINNITNAEDLLDIKRFVIHCNTYPQPIKKAKIGSFTENGDYDPNTPILWATQKTFNRGEGRAQRAPIPRYISEKLKTML